MPYTQPDAGRDGNPGITDWGLIRGTLTDQSDLAVALTTRLHAALLTSEGSNVLVCPYVAIPETAADYGAASATAREFLVFGNQYRIRQSGTITQVKFKIGALDNLTAVYIKVWRKNSAGTYDLVGSSENLLAALTGDAVNTVALSSPIAGVQEGDYYSVRVTSSANIGDIFVKGGGTLTDIYYVNGAAPAATGFAWASQGNDNEVTIPVGLYMAAPVLVGFGDSNMAGSGGRLDGSGGGHVPFTSTSLAGTNLTGHVSYLVAQGLGGVSFQNMGIVGNSVSNLVTRLTADVLDLKPRVVLFNIGTNDLNAGRQWANVVANYTAMLDSVIAIGALPVCAGIPPCSEPVITYADYHSRRATWNAALQTLVESKGGIYINLDPYVGQYHEGDTAGTLNDIATAYLAYGTGQDADASNGDGIHFGPDGKVALAAAFLDGLADYAVFNGAIMRQLLQALGGIKFADGSKLDTGDRTVIVKVVAEGTALTTGDGKAYFTVPELLDGNAMLVPHAAVYDVSTSGAVTYQIHNVTDGVDMLSTPITIDANEFNSYTAATPAVVNASYAIVSTGDRLRIDCDGAGTGTYGTDIIMVFRKP
jgi:lysophospholipase L1-like esterase